MCSCRENLPLQAEAPVWKEAPWSSVTGSVSLHFTQLLSILAGLSEAHGAGCCASAATDEDTSGRNGKTSTPSAFFSNPDVCLPWRSTWRYHFCFDDVGQSLVCVQSKLAYLGMPAAMQNKRKGKQALKWALKLSSWCSENKSHFAAKKKKKNQLAAVQYLSFPCILCFHSHLCSVMLSHKLTPVKTQQHLPNGAATGLAQQSSLLLLSHTWLRSPSLQCRHGDGLGAGCTSPPPAGASGQSPQCCQGWLKPSISHHCTCTFLPSLILGCMHSPCAALCPTVLVKPSRFLGTGPQAPTLNCSLCHTGCSPRAISRHQQQHVAMCTQLFPSEGQMVIWHGHQPPHSISPNAQECFCACTVYEHRRTATASMPVGPYSKDQSHGLHAGNAQSFFC